jgi:hypothetical protein
MLSPALGELNRDAFARPFCRRSRSSTFRVDDARNFRIKPKTALRSAPLLV